VGRGIILCEVTVHFSCQICLKILPELTKDCGWNKGTIHYKWLP